MSQAAKPIPQRIFTWCWRRPWFRKAFYNGVVFFSQRKTTWRMMNCGYRSAAPLPDLPTETDGEHHGYELYAHLVAGTPLVGRDVLELGCGRGGGAGYLHRFHRTKRMVALDYALSSVRWCRRHFASDGIEFVCGDAGAPPFPDASFDVIVAVEVTHCLADKPRFLASAARLLRPGGRLLVADFFYQRPDAMHALAKFENSLAGSAFRVIAADDWTGGVISAIEADSERRIAKVRERVPRIFQEIALGFASTTASSTYLALRAGRTVYRRYVLELPAVAAR